MLHRFTDFEDVGYDTGMTILMISSWWQSWVDSARGLQQFFYL